MKIIGIILVVIALDVLLDLSLIKLASKRVISLPLRLRKPAREQQPFEAPLPASDRFYLRFDLIEAQKYMDLPGYEEHSYPVDGDSVVIDYRWILDNEEGD